MVASILILIQTSTTGCRDRVRASLMQYLTTLCGEYHNLVNAGCKLNASENAMCVDAALRDLGSSERFLACCAFGRCLLQDESSKFRVCSRMVSQ